MSNKASERKSKVSVKNVYSIVSEDDMEAIINDLLVELYGHYPPFVKDACMKKKLTNIALHEGVSVQAVSKWLRFSSIPSKRIQSIAKFVGLKPTDFRKV